ncbi:hypothetical protein [Mesorhizobium sp. WSM2239]|uniref:Uncharacterized protein n=2 Tax=unclassified Mesorhizobium TaxID=325217 RepID=A0AAU8DBM2_9HYPH
MISESARYYGVVLSYLVDNTDGPILICQQEDALPGEYLINESVSVLIKYSTRRKGPWSFNVHRSHLLRVKQISKSVQKSVVVFVCGSDGIVAIALDDLNKIVVDGPAQQAISVRRKLRQMYGLKGPAGGLDRRLSRGSLASLIQA